MRQKPEILSIVATALGCLLFIPSLAGAASIGITADGRFFTIDGTPQFLMGVSYYGAGTITTTSYRTQDLDDMVADGFNWIRVWAHWKTDDGEDASALTHDGQVREPYMTRLKTLITECNSRGIMVDVTLNRDANQTWVGAWNQTEHLACVQTLANQLISYRNVYFDVSNERDVQDGRYVSLAQVGQLIDAVHAIDSGRKCTASSVPTSQGNLADFKNVGHMDFIAPHLCRDQGCAGQTYGTVTQYITWMTNLGWRIPIHLQEPFRRAYGGYNPVESDFLQDCNGGKVADATGWCFHNEKCFDMDNTHGRMYAQFDSVETNVSNWLIGHIASTSAYIRRYQPEWSEEQPQQNGRADGDGRSANVAQDAAGYLTYGPYTRAFPVDDYQATWRMLVDNNTANNDNVVTIDVYDPDGGGVRATRTITRQEWTAANTYQDFTLTFSHVSASHRLEFRTNWLDKSYLRLDYIDVRKQSTPVAPIINEVTPDPGTVLVFSPYTRQLTLAQGYPAPTWSKIAGPTSATVNSSGYVSGWTPAAGDVGTTKTFTIRATNSQGSDDETWQVQVTDQIATYEGSTGLSHLCGSEITGNDWRCTSSSSNCFMAFGPYVTSLPAGNLTARFWLRVDNNKADDQNVCQIDVNDADGSLLAGPYTLSRMDFSQANTYQAFDVDFTNPGGGHRIEFRIYYYSSAQLDLDKVEVFHYTVQSINYKPNAVAGDDATVVWPDNDVALDGTVVDDGLPNPPGAVTVTWTKQSGPGTVSFANANAVDTTATFSAQGTYVLRLTASDSVLSDYDEVTVTVSDCSPALEATLQGSSGFGHLCGSAISGDDWRVTVASNNCYMAYGPYTSSLPAGDLTARWYLRVDNNTADNADICQIDVYDATGSQMLSGPLTISRMDWSQAGVYQAFDLAFANPGGGHQLEFRTYYIWYAQLDLDKVEIWSACGGGGEPETISLSSFASSADGWTAEGWKAGQYSNGTMAFNGSTGNPAGSMKSTGSGSTNTTDSCTREGGLIKKVISTAGYESITLDYDLRFNTDQSGTTCSGGCTSTVLEGNCADKLAVYYGTSGTGGPWTLLEQVYASQLTQGTFYSRHIDLPAGAANQANFALMFKCQFNTSSDVGYLDNIEIGGVQQ